MAGTHRRICQGVETFRWLIQLLSMAVSAACQARKAPPQLAASSGLPMKPARCSASAVARSLVCQMEAIDARSPVRKPTSGRSRWILHMGRPCPQHVGGVTTGLGVEGVGFYETH